jgi:TM2 domain-containing membrane protein YozV
LWDACDERRPAAGAGARVALVSTPSIGAAFGRRHERAARLPSILPDSEAPVGTYLPDRPTKYCHACTRTIDAMAVVCTSCGVMQPDAGEFATDKRIAPAALFCFFLGVFGAHRFYVGKTGTAILQLVTLGGLGIWMLVDLIMIVTGGFRDADGNKITEWV